MHDNINSTYDIFFRLNYSHEQYVNNNRKSTLPYD
jgi:hypothetical protein